MQRARWRAALTLVPVSAGGEGLSEFRLCVLEISFSWLRWQASAESKEPDQNHLLTGASESGTTLSRLGSRGSGRTLIKGGTNRYQPTSASAAVWRRFMGTFSYQTSTRPTNCRCLAGSIWPGLLVAAEERRENDHRGADRDRAVNARRSTRDH